MDKLFSYSGLVLALTCFSLLILIIKYGKSKLHKIWAFFNFTVGFWGFGMFLVGRAHSQEIALTFWRFAHIGGIFIGVSFFHVVYEFCKLRKRRILILTYIYGALFVFLSAVNPGKIYMSETELLFGSIYYLKANYLYGLSVFFWITVVLYAFAQLLKYYKLMSPIKRMQILYFVVAMVVGFSGGVTYFLPMFGIKMFPIGNFTIPLYCLIVTYAILRYRLLDLSIAITRTSIFVAVYSIVLGIPFALAFGWKEKLISLLGENWWMGPLICSTVLATAGPFIYLYIQKKAEDKLLQRQRRYQSTLRQASVGMGRIKDLRRLLNLIVRIITRTVNIEFGALYLFDQVKKQYSLKAVRGKEISSLNIINKLFNFARHFNRFF